MSGYAEQLFKGTMPTRPKHSKLKVFVAGAATVLGRRILTALSNQLHSHAFSLLCGVHAPAQVDAWQSAFPNVEFADMGPTQDLTPGKVSEILNEWGYDRAVDRMLIIPQDYQSQYFKTLIEGAKIATVRHFVLLSSWTAGHQYPAIRSMNLHGADEPHSSADLWLSQKYCELEEILTRELVETCSYTSILRIGPLQQNLFKVLCADVQRYHAVRLPFDSSVAFAPLNAEEIPRAVGTVLADFENHCGTHVLTGPELLGGAEIAAAFESALGTPVKYQECSFLEMKDILDGQGWSEEESMKILEEFELLRKEGSKSSGVRNDLCKLIGRESKGFSTFVNENRMSLLAEGVEE